MLGKHITGKAKDYLRYKAIFKTLIMICSSLLSPSIFVFPSTVVIYNFILKYICFLWKVCIILKSSSKSITEPVLSHEVTSYSFATPWSVAPQAPLSMEFPRQASWNGLPISFSRESFWPTVWTQVSYVSCIAGRFFTQWASLEGHRASRQRQEGITHMLNVWEKPAGGTGFEVQVLVLFVHGPWVGTLNVPWWPAIVPGGSIELPRLALPVILLGTS